MRHVICATLAVFGVLLIIVTLVELSTEIKPAIYYAVRNGDTNAVQRYINNGGDVNRRIQLHKVAPTLLGIAISAGRVNLVDLLLKNKADPNFIAGGFYCYPLVRVVDADEVSAPDDPYLKIMKLLLAHGANPNLIELGGHHCPALYDAANFGNTKMIKLLLAAGANPNATNEFGQIPLHIVKNVESARLLLAAGADCKALANGETPAEVASRDKRLKVYEFLLRECPRRP
jgi:ankyrin repeat protein